MGGEGEGGGVKGGGKWGERGREVGIGFPPVHPLNYGTNISAHCEGGIFTDQWAGAGEDLIVGLHMMPCFDLSSVPMQVHNTGLYAAYDAMF